MTISWISTTVTEKTVGQSYVLLYNFIYIYIYSVGMFTACYFSDLLCLMNHFFYESNPFSDWCFSNAIEFVQEPDCQEKFTRPQQSLYNETFVFVSDTRVSAREKKKKKKKEKVGKRRWRKKLVIQCRKCAIHSFSDLKEKENLRCVLFWSE